MAFVPSLISSFANYGVYVFVSTQLYDYDDIILIVFHYRSVVTLADSAFQRTGTVCFGPTVHSCVCIFEGCCSWEALKVVINQVKLSEYSIRGATPRNCIHYIILWLYNII